MTSLFTTDQLPNIFFAAQNKALKETIQLMDTIMHHYTLKAARGESSWVCSDCCVVVPEGMPGTCPHGLQKCTSIIKRDKSEFCAKTNK